MTNATQTLTLSIGDEVPGHRLGGSAWSGEVVLLDKPVQVEITSAAVQAAARSAHPIMVELELYFSCLVRKQVRFSELSDIHAAGEHAARIMPGLYAGFRAVTTAHCKIADTDGKPPVETMPVKKPGQFVPDWLRIDYRSGRWLGDYGFTRSC